MRVERQLAVTQRGEVTFRKRSSDQQVDREENIRADMHWKRSKERFGCVPCSAREVNGA
jgi:hypothetical protein